MRATPTYPTSYKRQYERLRNQNLLGRLTYVYQIMGSEAIESVGSEIVLSNTHDDFLGCSRVVGVFHTQAEALKFARKYGREVEVK